VGFYAVGAKLVGGIERIAIVFVTTRGKLQKPTNQPTHLIVH